MKTIILFIILAFVCISVNAQDVLDNKVYRVTGYKKGNNSVSSLSNYAEILPHLSLFIPDAFTPNGDGINDTFGVKGEGLQNFTMRIFNRWGEKIYESNNPKQQWDGTYKGKPVQTDTYVFQIIASGIGAAERTGSVTLIR